MTTEVYVDLSKVIAYPKFIGAEPDNKEEVIAMYGEAKEFLSFYDWCKEITESYVGMVYAGIIGIFLFRIPPGRDEIDEWVWVLVGDLPSAYLTCENCPNPATALDGYIGAMSEWVEAAEKGESVAQLIPVNVPATKENAEKLKTRLKFLDEKILGQYTDDLKD